MAGERWYLRVGDGTVHRVFYPSIGISDLTYCGVKLATLYDLESKLSYLEQMTLVQGPATCVLCIHFELHASHEDEPYGGDEED